MQLQSDIQSQSRTMGLAARGFRPLYRAGSVNHCPGCGQTQWHVGRMSAECAHCGTAIPLAHVAAQPMQPLFHVTESATILAA
ncbi:hypothetical protein [Alterisphingorhabdus coralli]|uniref:Uncharacterized protein n=1 Tax=Alterisphingorhabdus coralli TaxID=3071408 RepID=A0AA97FAQ9_9SPHN|nr:hypothetical protein [Parasphingorhabdus sp. SCSIO 66989]WOE76167.1 hypothetical protein RB602_05495 [Parasphingorhabdus sp. SCSIO 66989]